MEIREENLDGLMVLKLTGRLDASNADSLKRLVKERCEEGKNRVCVDMEGVSFTDSSGIGALVVALKTLTDARGDMCLCALTPEVRSLFELVRLHKLFEIHGTLEDARAWFAHGGV